jgi:hypothetical protein
MVSPPQWSFVSNPPARPAPITAAMKRLAKTCGWRKDEALRDAFAGAQEIDELTEGLDSNYSESNPVSLIHLARQQQRKG